MYDNSDFIDSIVFYHDFWWLLSLFGGPQKFKKSKKPEKTLCTNLHIFMFFCKKVKKSQKNPKSRVVQKKALPLDIGNLSQNPGRFPTKKYIY
jgi:hypothetical protein